MSQEAKKPRITWLLDALRSSKHRLHHYTPKLQKHSTELIERLGKKLPDFKSSMQKTDCELTNKGGSKASQTFSKVTSKIKSTVGSGINASKPFINSTVEKATKVFGSTTNAFKQAFKAATRASADKFKKNINKGGELGQNLAKLAVSSAQHLNTKYSIAGTLLLSMSLHSLFSLTHSLNSQRRSHLEEYQPQGIMDWIRRHRCL